MPISKVRNLTGVLAAHISEDRGTSLLIIAQCRGHVLWTGAKYERKKPLRSRFGMILRGELSPNESEYGMHIIRGAIIAASKVQFAGSRQI